jgi:MFS family permease
VTHFAITDQNGRLVTADQAALLLSYVGITNTFGRMLFGWISDRLQQVQPKCNKLDRSFLNALGINNLCLLCAGLSTALLPILNSYLQVALNCLVFGLCCGTLQPFCLNFVSFNKQLIFLLHELSTAAYMCLTSIILVDQLGLHRLTNAFGLISMGRGIGSLIGPPIAGLLYDWTDSYQATFATAGLLFIISAILSVCAAITKT